MLALQAADAVCVTKALKKASMSENESGWEEVLGLEEVHAVVVVKACIHLRLVTCSWKGRGISVQLPQLVGKIEGKNCHTAPLNRSSAPLSYKTVLAPWLSSQTHVGPAFQWSSLC